jgi:hypothetical protein
MMIFSVCSTIVPLIFAVGVTMAFLPIARLLHPFIAMFAIVTPEVFAALTAAALKACSAFLGCQSSSRHGLFSFPSLKYLPIKLPANIVTTPTPRNNNSFLQLSGVHNATAMPAMISNAPIVFLAFIVLWFYELFLSNFDFKPFFVSG